MESSHWFCTTSEIICGLQLRISWVTWSAFADTRAVKPLCCFQKKTRKLHVKFTPNVFRLFLCCRKALWGGMICTIFAYTSVPTVPQKSATSFFSIALPQYMKVWQDCSRLSLFWRDIKMANERENEYVVAILPAWDSMFTSNRLQQYQCSTKFTNFDTMSHWLRSFAVCTKKMAGETVYYKNLKTMNYSDYCSTCAEPMVCLRTTHVLSKDWSKLRYAKAGGTIASKKLDT
jgi:hypothetical protein